MDVNLNAKIPEELKVAFKTRCSARQVSMEATTEKAIRFWMEHPELVEGRGEMPQVVDRIATDRSGVPDRTIDELVTKVVAFRTGGLELLGQILSGVEQLPERLVPVHEEGGPVNGTGDRDAHWRVQYETARKIFEFLKDNVPDAYRAVWEHFDLSAFGLKRAGGRRPRPA